MRESCPLGNGMKCCVFCINNVFTDKFQPCVATADKSLAESR